jgi:hypothetical protein
MPPQNLSLFFEAFRKSFYTEGVGFFLNFFREDSTNGTGNASTTLVGCTKGLLRHERLHRRTALHR